jgi:hypothetical protein
MSNEVTHITAVQDRRKTDTHARRNNCRGRSAVFLIVMAACTIGFSQIFPDGSAVVTRNGSTDNIDFRHQDYGVYNGELWRYTIMSGVVRARKKIFPGPATFPRISPDGSKVAFIREIGPVSTLCVIDINGDTVTELTPCAPSSLVDFAADDWVYFTLGSGQQNIDSRYLRRVHVPDKTVENVATFPCTIAQINISRDLTRAVIRNSSPGVLTCGDEKAYAYSMILLDSGSFGTDMTPGRICCVTAMFSDGQYGAFGWVSHLGTDIKPWGSPDTIVKSVDYQAAFGWPPNRNADNPPTSDVGPVFTSRASTNGPYWECLLFNDEAFLLINWSDEQCINVTALTSGNVGQGDFWVGSPQLGDITPPLSAPLGCTVSGCTETSVSLSWNALPGSADPESGIEGYAVFRGSLQVGGTITAAAYTDTGLAPATLYQYQIAGVNGVGMDGPKSATISTSTLADQTPPSVRSVIADFYGSGVVVRFSERVEMATAETPANFTIDKSIIVYAATLSADSMSVYLTVSPMTLGTSYTLAVSAVRDLSGNTIAPNSIKAFVYNPGLEAQWKFEETGGPLAVDASGNGWDGVLSGNASRDSGDAKEGKYSLRLVDSGGFTAPLPSLAFYSFSVAFWIKSDTLTLFNQDVYASSGWGAFKFSARADGTVYCGISESDRFQLAAGTMVEHAWQHYALTFVNGTACMYRNGILVETQTGWSNSPAWTSFTISSPTGASGLFDDVRIYWTALTDQEVMSVVTGPLPAEAISVTGPAAGTICRTGGWLDVAWTIDPVLVTGGVIIDLSVTNGRVWYPLIGQLINPGDPAYYTGNNGAFSWPIPDTFHAEGGQRVFMVSDSCRIRVRAPYAPNTPMDQSAMFALRRPEPARQGGKRFAVFYKSNGDLLVRTQPEAATVVQIFDILGRIRATEGKSGAGEFRFSYAVIGRGIRFIKITAGGEGMIAKVVCY